MREGFKYSWIVLCVCCGFALIISLIPFAKWQKSYMTEYYRLKNEPQRRIEATYEYLEALEDGKTEVSPDEFYNKLVEDQKIQSIQFEKPKFKPKQKQQKTYKTPLYLRDKDNPKKIKPYRAFWWR